MNRTNVGIEVVCFSNPVGIKNTGDREKSPLITSQKTLNKGKFHKRSNLLACFSMELTIGMQSYENFPILFLRIKALPTNQRPL